MLTLARTGLLHIPSRRLTQATGFMFSRLIAAVWQVTDDVLAMLQRDNLFYPSWAFQLPNMVLLQWPQAFVESLVWSVLA